MLNESNYLKIDNIFTKIYDCDLVAIKYSQGMSGLGIRIQTPRAPGCLTVVQLNGYDIINPKTMLELVKAYSTDRFKTEVHYTPIPECRINEMTANGFLYKGPKIGSLSELDIQKNVLFAVYSWENPDLGDTRSSEHNAHKLQLFSPFQQSLGKDKMSEALMNFQMQMGRIKG